MLNNTNTKLSAQAEKLLILGCGDIGQRSARQLAASGQYAITGLRRHPPANSDLLSYRACDLRAEGELLRQLREGWDLILITMTPSEQSDAGYKSAYVDTCQTLVDSLQQLEKQPRLVIFVSSTSVYGQDDGGWVDENSICSPSSYSGKRLLEAEQIIARAAFNSCILRFSGIYGPGRTRLIQQVMDRRASASQGYTNRIHAEDCAGVIAHLIERQKMASIAPLYVATDSSPAPMLEVVTWIAEQLAIKEFLAPDTTNSRGNKRIHNQRLLESGYEFRYPHFRQGYAELLRELKRLPGD